MTKVRVMFLRQLRHIFWPVVCLWPGLVVALLGVRWGFALLGWAADLQVSLLGPWTVICALFSAFQFRGEFNLGMQTGVSRKHIFVATLGAWGLTLLVIAGGLGVLAQALPHLPILQDLGYVGVWDRAAQVASAATAGLMLVVAIGAGLTYAVFAAALPPAWLGALGLGVLGLVWWVSFATTSAHLTQNIANGAFTGHHAGIAATPYLWPLLLAGVAAGLLLIDWLAIMRLEPRAK